MTQQAGVIQWGECTWCPKDRGSAEGSVERDLRQRRKLLGQIPAMIEDMLAGAWLRRNVKSAPTINRIGYAAVIEDMYDL